MEAHKIRNRTLFIGAVILTGAVAGAFVWAFFFVMNLGLNFLWKTVPESIGFAFFPLVACTLGGLIIGLYEKRFGPYPEELNSVMKKVKENGRYEYDSIGVSSVAALLPLLFGGSIGPEAGLTGAIAGLCTWVGDRMKRFGSDFKHLTQIGTSAALTAIFTAPLLGFAAPLYGSLENNDNDDEGFVIPKTSKIIIYFCAIAGALGAFMGLGALFGTGGGLPHFSEITIGTTELIWLIPIVLIGAIGGWLYHLFNRFSLGLSTILGKRPVIKAVIAGFVLAACGMMLPFTMFSGESQTHTLSEIWLGIPAIVLLLTGFVKLFVTPFCINMGWRGGHFFPVIFAGISIGYGCAALTGADPVFCMCASTAAICGGVMRQPLMAVLLLFLCFPVKGIVIMLIGALIGSVIPLPKFLKEE
ncbi:MAG: chloride channel protein, partial [Raoultibacter sp.]